jgi:hypothetical protein
LLRNGYARLHDDHLLFIFVWACFQMGISWVVACFAELCRVSGTTSDFERTLYLLLRVNFIRYYSVSTSESKREISFSSLFHLVRLVARDTLPSTFSSRELSDASFHLSPVSCGYSIRLSLERFTRRSMPGVLPLMRRWR